MPWLESGQPMRLRLRKLRNYFTNKGSIGDTSHTTSAFQEKLKNTLRTMKRSEKERFTPQSNRDKRRI